jgi:drug/metabolite transporter (DMT)-like permease
MWKYIWPVLLIVISNVFYNISTRSTPGSASPLASLTVTYIIAAVSSGILFFITSPSKDLIGAYRDLDWSCLALGIAVVGLEYGYIWLYRSGWMISTGSLTANIMLAVILIIVGILFYKEHISLNQIIGIALCLAGFIFINK